MKFWKKMALGSTAVLAAMSLAACSNGHQIHQVVAAQTRVLI